MKKNIAMNDGVSRLIIDALKASWVAILSLFAPTETAIKVLLVFFVLNILVGVRADRAVSKKEFSLKKFMSGFMLFGLFYAIILAVNLALSSFGEADIAFNSMKFLTWLMCYGYLVNIVRNARLIHPENETLEILHDVLTIEIFDALLGKFGFGKKYRERKDNERK